MGRYLHDDVVLRGVPGCDPQIIERRLLLGRQPVTGPMRNWDFKSQHVLLAGSHLKFTVLAKRECSEADHFVYHNGQIIPGPAWWLDVPYDLGYDDGYYTTVPYYNGLRITK